MLSYDSLGSKIILFWCEVLAKKHRLSSVCGAQHLFNLIIDMKPYTLCIAFWVLFVTIGLAQLIFSSNPDNPEDQLIEEEDGDSWSETSSRNHEAIQSEFNYSRHFHCE